MSNHKKENFGIHSTTHGIESAAFCLCLHDGKKDGTAKMMRGGFSNSWEILLPWRLTLALLDVMLSFLIRNGGYTRYFNEQAQPR